MFYDLSLNSSTWFFVFPLFLPRCSVFVLCEIVNVVYDPFLAIKTPFFKPCSYFPAHPTTLLLKILGDVCMGLPPTSNSGGNVPPSLLGLPPGTIHFCLSSLLLSLRFCHSLCSVLLSVLPSPAYLLIITIATSPLRFRIFLCILFSRYLHASVPLRCIL